MKLLSSIVWSEGMYLGPHHFQAQNRYFEDSVSFATQALWYAAYGFTGYAVDPEALRNGTVALTHAHGIFSDGLVFDIPESDAAPEPRSIADLFPPTRDWLIASLAVPRRKSDGQNVVLEAENKGQVRFMSAPTTICDENTGRDEKPVQVGRKNIRLCFDVESSEDMELLPVARIKRDTSGQFVCDPTYIPPCLRLTASEALMMLLRRLIEILEEKSATLLREHATQGKFQAGMSAREVTSFWFLHTINAGLGPLRHLFFSKRGHPEELFREMSRLAGSLCTFSVDSTPRDLPTYNHREADASFYALDEHIRLHLEIIIPSKAISIPLHPVRKYFYEGEVTDSRATQRSRWLLGIHSPLGEADLIKKTLTVLKFCSAKFVPELMKRALPGMKMTHLPVPPSAISPKVAFEYFSIEAAGPCWDHIVQTRQVGIYVPGEIPNPELELLVIIDS